MTRESVFTQHVRDLVRGNVTREELLAPWEKLRDALISEMRHRALLTASPACLGIYGVGSWTKEALDELATDCYSSVFLRRLPSLAAQLGRKVNVEGLIFRNIRFYLHEIQRKHDPVGFRVYTALRAAVCAAVDRGALRVEQGDPAVRNDTVLALPRQSSFEIEPEDGDGADLESVVRRWSEELLPDLVTARGTALDPIVDDLAERLSRLADHGVATFRFQEVSKLLKDQVRSRWQALWAHDHPAPDDELELWDLASVVGSASSFEEREAFEKLVTCVSEVLETMPAAPRTRSYLHRLWVFLWNHAAENGDALPSQRQISRLLEIPRARFAELYATLGRTVELCREVHSGERTQHKLAGNERKV
jgi:hypothetical protein